MNYDAWKSDAPDPGTVPDTCECGAELLPYEGPLCVVCQERIDLGRLDGPDYDDAEGL